MIRKLTVSDEDLLLSYAKNTLQNAEHGHEISDLLKERVHLYETIGSFDGDDLNGILVYEKELFRIIFLLKDTDTIGTSLLDEFVHIAENQNIAKITVNALEQDVQFYTDYGFDKTGEEMKAGKLTFVPMEYLTERRFLGTTVTVIIDHPYGSLHPSNPDVLYPLNCGYIRQDITNEDTDFQNAYVYGPEEPLDTFTGVVAGIVYHREDNLSRWIVIPAGMVIDHNAIIQKIAFEEQYYDTRIIWA